MPRRLARDSPASARRLSVVLGPNPASMSNADFPILMTVAFPPLPLPNTHTLRAPLGLPPGPKDLCGIAEIRDDWRGEMNNGILLTGLSDIRVFACDCLNYPYNRHPRLK